MKPAPIDPPEIQAQLWREFTGTVGWDVGANCGHTIGIMRQRFDKVVAFEPADECIPFLQGAGATVVQLAVSDVDGHINLLELPDKIDTGQLVSDGITGMEWSSDDPNRTLRQVPARRLDTLLDEMEQPDFIKVDVEGHELRVLHGAARMLSDIRPAWLIEFHSSDLAHECSRILVEHDYTVMTVRHPHYAKNSDLYFQHGWLRAFPM